MKKCVQVLILGTFLIPIYLLYGQPQTKSINLEGNVTIQEVSETKNYVTIKAGRQEPNFKYTAYVLDKTGNKLLEKTGEDNRFMVQAEAVEPLNYFIVVQQGYEGYEGTPGKDDLIQAFDIKTGNEVWQTRANALRYSVSPDGKYMITQSHASMGGPSGSKFMLINLQNGTTISHTLKLRSWFAEWLDNDRIVIALQQIKKNPETKNYYEDLTKKNRERNSLIDSLIHQRMRLSIELKMRKVSQQEYDTKLAENNQKCSELNKQKSEVERIKNLHQQKPAMMLAASKLMIYNMNTHQIELEKEIYAPDGSPIVLESFSNEDIGTLSVEQSTQTIYFRGHKGNSDVASACLTKLDKLLGVSMVTPLAGMRLIKLKVEDELFFVARKQGTQYVMDKKSGALIQTNKINTKTGEITVDSNLSTTILPIKTYVKGLSIEQKNNAIEFSIRKEAEQ
jgi:hypothetical protein